jgi:GT2 family glycosyltransferase/glycosyltransferase involved in cell wall biosynthesis
MENGLTRTAIVIIGMHRAGTSALARVCSLRGAALPHQLLPANQGNVSGYWEPRGITELNERILDYYDLSWDDPFAPGCLPAPVNMPPQFVAEARQLLEEEYGDAPLFVLKDPRCTLLQAFWQQVLASSDIRMCAVVMMRPWVEVVDSLVRRDGTDPASAALLYVAYGVEAAKAVERAASVVTYRQLVDDWRLATDRIAREQGFAWPEDASASAERIREFLRPAPELTEQPAIADGLRIWAETIWNWFRDAASADAPPSGALQAIGVGLQGIAWVAGSLLRDRKVALRDVQASRDAAIADRDTALEVYRDTREELRRTQADYTLRDQEYRQRSAEYVATLAELDLAHAALGATRHELDSLLQSRSWKLTAPLRSAMRWLQRLKQRRPISAGVGDQIARWPETVHGAPHSGLRNFLEAEFDARIAVDVIERIDRYHLPVPSQEARAASRLECPDADAIAWAQAIAQQAPRARVSTATDDAPPDVSIVIPVYNQAPFTLACIEALLQHASRYRIEMLIGDDGSTDATVAALAVTMPGVRHIRHERNLGFVRNCNATAAHARGRYLLLLNNDTLVLPGWLDELIGTLDADGSVGLAGSKLIYPDGRLQECGAIVWRDGSAWNYGRLADPRRPEFNYLRDVDYVSGASIALPMPMWQQLGGFDELFVPAYAEDADLAFRVRAAGLRTVVQPLSQLLHFEGISSGTDLGAGAKAHQGENLGKLHARWAGTLASHRNNADQPELEKERGVQRRVLFIDHCTPTPEQDAGSLVAFEVMQAFLANGYKVTFIPEDNFAHAGAHTRALQRIGIETIHHPAYSCLSEFLATRREPFDTIFLHRFGVADAHLKTLRRAYPGARILFLNADLHYLRQLRQAEIDGDAAAMAAARLVRERELRVIAAADVSLVHSDHEQALLQRELPEANIVLFPLVHEPATQVASLSLREGVCFVGGFRHPPNADGIGWFVQAVWPLVLEHKPDARLYIVGSHMPPEVKALAAVRGVEAVGFVDDLDAFLDRRRVSVAPLRYGAGAKGKVAGSLARGLPVVCTPVAAEGMALTPGHNVLVGETPQALARHLVTLLTDDARWQSLSEASLSYAREVTSRASAHRRMREILGLAGPATD